MAVEVAEFSANAVGVPCRVGRTVLVDHALPLVLVDENYLLYDVKEVC